MGARGVGGARNRPSGKATYPNRFKSSSVRLGEDHKTAELRVAPIGEKYPGVVLALADPGVLRQVASFLLRLTRNRLPPDDLSGHAATTNLGRPYPTEAERFPPGNPRTDPPPTRQDGGTVHSQKKRARQAYWPVGGGAP